MELAYGKINLSSAEILRGVLKTDKKPQSLNWLVLNLKYYIIPYSRKLTMHFIHAILNFSRQFNVSLIINVQFNARYFTTLLL